ncbi:DNA polymerase III subunit chi [Variovorax sp. J22R133]|uniref:DNA polymerase III subunit chi n=1 Tax=Variovorax brevis TaxID=3053503 RepID=UPI002577AE30|nr:DNA polymerase III subunit chi [Variovorax sp. J22R133]MDM0110765.1 DNA polymerase III subunit chi [Variovorax sp. J22R133]
MTGIEFRFNAADKVDYACRLLRKAVAAKGAQLVVTADPVTLGAVDAALWQLSPTDFVAHCHADAQKQVLSRSPVVLAIPNAGSLPDRPVLINLSSEVPVGFERFERLIELVGCDEGERQAGRVRWRHYTERGYAMTRMDLSGKDA